MKAIITADCIGPKGKSLKRGTVIDFDEKDLALVQLNHAGRLAAHTPEAVKEFGVDEDSGKPIPKK